MRDEKPDKKKDSKKPYQQPTLEKRQCLLEVTEGEVGGGAATP